VAIGGHAKLVFTAIHPHEKQVHAVPFLRNAVTCYVRLGITVKRLLTDTGLAFCSRDFRAACVDLGIKHGFTRPCRPQTNGKAMAPGRPPQATKWMMECVDLPGSRVGNE